MNTWPIVKLIKEQIDFEKLKLEVLDSLEKYAGEENQIILQTLQEGLEDWHTGVGKVEQLDVKMENDYFHIQPSLAGTELEKIMKRYSAFRTRIMRMPPKFCYSVHEDATPRIHIPIVTNNQAWMVWPYESKTILLREGLTYWTDTTRHHTFFNGSDDYRIHLVMCVDGLVT